MAKKLHYRRVWLALLASNGLSLLFLGLRVLESQSDRYWFLVWNLFLAWLPLLFGWWLVQRLRRGVSWLSAGNVALSVLWLGFLPNSFYVVSDLIHLHATGEVSLLYDAVMFTSFIFNGYVAGFMSLVLVHRAFIKKLGMVRAHAVIAGVLLACSFAIYLGRNLRWNTWDILVNPAGLLFDVSDRFINPAAHSPAFVTTAMFFLLLGGMYVVIWQLLQALRTPNR